MNADGFRFAGLDAHIGEVDRGVVEPMRRAGEAGRPLDHLAYGVVGQAFAVLVTGAAASASHSVRGLGEEAAGLRERLVETDRVYRRVEQRNCILLDALPTARGLR